MQILAWPFRDITSCENTVQDINSADDELTPDYIKESRFGRYIP